MGFLADIAQGVGRSTLDRQQTELLRFLEEERFNRAQEAQIASEERQFQRQQQIADEQLKRSLGIATLQQGVSEDQEASTIGMFSPDVQPLLQTISDYTQQQKFISEYQGAVSSKDLTQFDFHRNRMVQLSEEFEIPLPQETVENLDFHENRVKLETGRQYMATDLQIRSETLQKYTPEEIESLGEQFGVPARAAALAANNEFDRIRVLRQQQQEAAQGQIELQAMSIMADVVDGKISIEDVPPYWREQIERIRPKSELAAVAWNSQYKTTYEVLPEKIQYASSVEMEMKAMASQGIQSDPAEIRKAVTLALTGTGLTYEDYQEITNGLMRGDESAEELIYNRATVRSMMNRNPELREYATARAKEYGNSILKYDDMSFGTKKLAQRYATSKIIIPGFDVDINTALAASGREFKSMGFPEDAASINKLILDMRIANSGYWDRTSDMALEVNFDTGLTASMNAQLQQEKIGLFREKLLNRGGIEAQIKNEREETQQLMLTGGRSVGANTTDRSRFGVPPGYEVTSHGSIRKIKETAAIDNG